MANPSFPTSGAAETNGDDLSRARSLVLAFVTGEEANPAIVRPAIRLLVRADRAFLDRLEAAAYGAFDRKAGEECMVTFAALQEYLEMGDSESSIESQAHLQECEACRQALVLATAVATQEDQWLEFSRQIALHRTSPLPLLLVLLRTGWHWLTAAQSAPEPLAHRPAPSATDFSGFELGGAPEEELALAATAPSLRLALSLPPEGEIRIELFVRPSGSGGESGVWTLHLKLLAGAESDSVNVGAGSEERHHTGLRTLRTGRSVEFSLAPPPSPTRPVWLHFAWTTRGGMRRVFKAKLPLAVGSASA